MLHKIPDSQLLNKYKTFLFIKYSLEYLIPDSTSLLYGYH